MRQDLAYGAPLALGLALLAETAQAERFACQMQDGTYVEFTIDPLQFVAALDPREPIRRRITEVRMGDATFPAEPFRIGDMRGFSAEGLGGGTVMFVVQPDRSAQFSAARSGIKKNGTCEVFQ